MHRLNLTIDDWLYEEVKELSSVEKKSLSQLIVDSLEEYISKHSNGDKQHKLVLESEEEKEILKILNSDSFISNDVFKDKFNL